MARRNIPDSKRDQIVADWERGLYDNLARLAKAHDISYNTASSMVKKAKAIKGSRAGELGEIVEATRAYAKDPSPDTAKALEGARSNLQLVHLFDDEAIRKHANGLVAKELMEEIEEQLVRSTVVLIQARVNKNVRANVKTIYHKDFGEISAPLDSGDLKNYSDISDKTMISLGYAPRHAPKGDVNVNQQQAGAYGSVIDGIDGFYEEEDKKEDKNVISA